MTVPFFKFIIFFEGQIRVCSFFMLSEGDGNMPKISVPKLYDKEILEEYNYPETRDIVLQYFAKYRAYSNKIDELRDSYNGSLSNDNMGIFSSSINDPTSKRALRIAEYKEYIESMDEHLRTLKLKLTSEEKVIFKYSILSRHTDEELAEKLSLDRSNIYHRKKSCYIKVAKYFHIEVFN